MLLRGGFWGHTCETQPVTSCSLLTCVDGFFAVLGMVALGLAFFWRYQRGSSLVVAHTATACIEGAGTWNASGEKISNLHCNARRQLFGSTASS